MARLQQITTTGSQTTIDFTSIPGTYTSLILTGQLRNTDAGTSVTLGRVKVNNDGTAGNYIYVNRIISNAGAANGTGQASSAAGAALFAIPNDGNTAGSIAQVTLTFANYAGVLFFKGMESDYGMGYGSTADAGKYYATWASTAAITRLTLTTDGTAFKDGLVWSLYGVT